MEMTAWLRIVCVRGQDTLKDTLKRHSDALSCCLFLKVDAVKLVATNSEILLRY